MDTNASNIVQPPLPLPSEGQEHLQPSADAKAKPSYSVGSPTPNGALYVTCNGNAPLVKPFAGKSPGTQPGASSASTNKARLITDFLPPITQVPAFKEHLKSRKHFGVTL